MPAPVLVTIPISHFCEKARWALDRAGIAYEERPHLQLFHRFAARRAGGGSTVPVLVRDGGVLSESADIVEWADSRSASENRLYPSDPAVASEVRALEAGWDEGLGPDGRLWMYDSLRGRRDIALQYASAGVPAWERRLFPLGYPFVSRFIDRFLGITPEATAQAERDVNAAFDAVGTRLADGRPFLMGERFTAADLTFSALAASVLMPPEYGVPLPQPDELPEPMALKVRELRRHPAGQHAMRMFREERRVPSR
jgi:glutathione S-transferase